MPAITTKSDLSGAQQRLVLLLQTLNFGRIEALRVRSGEPCFDPPPRITEKRKLGGEHGPRREANLSDFNLKQSTIEMLEAIGEIQDGEVQAIEVKFGLPFALELEHRPRPASKVPRA